MFWILAFQTLADSDNEFSSLVAPILQCKHGYELHHNTCVRQRVHKPEPTCKEGELTEFGTCLQKISYKPYTACPEGYTAVGGKCEMVEMIAPEPHCKNGDYSNGFCIPNSKTERKPFCPSGYKLDDGVCVATHKHSSFLDCPTGFELNKNRCTKLEHTPAEFTCPSKFELIGGVCVKESKVQLECPVGTKYDEVSNLCIQSVKVSTHFACPSGFEQDGDDCYAYEFYPTEIKCRKDFTYIPETDKCIKLIEEQPKKECSEGDANEAGTECVKKLSAKAIELCLGAEDLSECVDYITFTPGFSCRNADKHGDTCKEAREPVLKCSRGALQGHSCAAELFVKPENVCANGEMSSDACVVTQSQPVSFECPRGTYDNNGECVYESVPAEFRCPRHYKMSDSGRCVKSIYTEPSAMCDPEAQLEGRRCNVYTEIPPEFRCKYGKVIDGVCTEQDVIDPEYTCPKGYKFDGDGNCAKRGRINKPSSPRLSSHHNVSVEDMYSHHHSHERAKSA